MSSPTSIKVQSFTDLQGNIVSTQVANSYVVLDVYKIISQYTDLQGNVNFIQASPTENYMFCVGLPLFTTQPVCHCSFNQSIPLLIYDNLTENVDGIMTALPLRFLNVYDYSTETEFFTLYPNGWADAGGDLITPRYTKLYEGTLIYNYTADAYGRTVALGRTDAVGKYQPWVFTIPLPTSIPVKILAPETTRQIPVIKPPTPTTPTPPTTTSSNSYLMMGGVALVVVFVLMKK